MPRSKHDLISIANPKLAKKLSANEPHVAAPSKSEPNSGVGNKVDPTLDTLVLSHEQIKQQSWRAILILNLLRYVLALWVLADMALGIELTWLDPSLDTSRPNVFIACTLTLLISAILFSYLSRAQIVPLTIVLIIQFVLDLIIATAVIHISGESSSNLFFIYFLIVTTGSVVLSRVNALGLASAAIVLILLEHLDSTLLHQSSATLNSEVIEGNAIVLLVSAYVISTYAQYLGKNQLSTFVPGTESLEAFLTREEINAINAALEQTKGNKTQAALLLGLTFRSFRYKLSKYSIE